ncbi:MAG: penicillin-binding transpeptidase domain-containing protein [Hungatella sp.]
MRTSQDTNQNTNQNSNHKKIFLKYMQEKLAITVIVIMLALFALIFVLYDIVNQKNEEYTKTVLSQHSSYDSRIIPYRRGDIVDRNGTYLATSEKVYNLILDPKQIFASEENYLTATVDALAQTFGYDRTELTTAITEQKDKAYLRYEKRLSYDKKEEFEKLRTETNEANRKAGLENRIKGVWFEDEYRRIYPYSKVACSVIGFSGSDSSEGTGGIEQSYNSTLIGTNGREYGYLNDDSNKETVIKSAENGNTIVSTIDINIQNLVEKRIAQFQSEMGSKQIAVIVMNPDNGEVLSMATGRQFDLNEPRDLSAYYGVDELQTMDEKEQGEAWNQMWRNFCVSDTFEPGSPSKVFTVAGGLEEGVVGSNTHFMCDGYQEVGGHRIKCTAYAKGGHGDLALDETLMVSCNDAMMQLAAMQGREKFCKYQKLFNFGSKTGIDLPGEADAKTLVYQADTMGPADLATNAFGQNYNCTMIQMAAAFSAAINGGSYYEPHVAKQVLNEQGSVVEKIDATLVRETISESTSDFLRKALARTVAEGTGKAAQVTGYEVGGKTGTAEKYPRGQKKYMVSFCGFAPATHPEVLVYVVIDEPNTEDQAHSTFASAVFSQIMGDILPYLNVFPTQDLPPVSEEVQGQLPEAEGITNPTMVPEGETTPETSESAEETKPEKLPYDTEEFVPVETGEDGSEISSALPGNLPGEPDSTAADVTEAAAASSQASPTEPPATTRETEIAKENTES